MTIDGPYLSQLALLGLLSILGWFIKSKLGEIMGQLETLTAGQAKSRERLIRIETKLKITDPGDD